ncbi:hypothetical protein LIER_26300 [Lithospermum erythrorhizon]|uniref:BolA-like protein n=1 Tax=Lithospermum erythrorhizon TaxID=34254 RepID=A0AAV3R843_LITER
MGRALLGKVHLWRSNGVVNYLLLSNNSKPQSNQVVSRTSLLNSDKFSFIRRTYCNESPLMQSMENKIKEQLNAESVTVKDAYGDGRHVSISVISTAFEGQNTVTRQRTVYKAIWEELQDSVHAVHQMITLTPTEAKTKSQ